MELKKLALKGHNNRKPIIIAGPCSAENHQQVIETARQLSQNSIEYMRAGIWKPRTKPGGFEGVGSIGLEWLKEAKKQTGIKLAIEIATPEHAHEALNAGIDLLWIGARTTTNPFAVQDIADSLKGTNTPILIKNPVNPDIELWIGAIERFYNVGIDNIGVIHRGFSTYNNKLYRNLPLWNIPIELKRRYPELTIICDPSHIGGKRELIAPISQQALDLNFDGLIIESHNSPYCALSDAAQQITPHKLNEIITNLIVRDNTTIDNSINSLREKIDDIDQQILELLANRMGISTEIGSYKRANNIPILQSHRYDEIIHQRAQLAKSLSINENFAKEIIKLIHEESVKIQLQQK